MSKLTRRSMLATGSALAAVPLALSTGAAATGHDPIYAAIEAHRTAERAFCKALPCEPNEDHPDHAGWLERTNRTGDAAAEARVALLETVPTTLAGLAVLLEYLWEGAAGAELLVDANETMTFLRSMHYAACSFAGLPRPEGPGPGDMAAIARRSLEN